MKIFHFSDPHTHENLLFQKMDVDMVICSGDISNSKFLELNIEECDKFIDWFSKLDIKYKIFTAGNHDLAIFHKNKYYRKKFKELGIIYLENEFITIENLRIFGSPYTPTYGTDWVYNKSRDKLFKFWENTINKPVDILITHGPPKNILDLTYNKENKLEFVGDRSLFKHICKLEPLISMFGHLHNNKDIINSGIKIIPDIKTIFSNGAIVEDGKFNKIVSNGNYFEIINNKVTIL